MKEQQIVNCDRIYIREIPSKEGGIVDILNAGITVNTEDEPIDGYFKMMDTDDAYISADYLKEV